MADEAAQQGTPRAQRLAQCLGWFGLGLGVPQIAMPDRVNGLIGVRDDSESRLWQRIVGVREVAASAGIFSGQPSRVAWLWARVAGDVSDVVLLGFAFKDKRRSAGRLAAAAGSVAAVTAMDLYAAMRTSRSGADTTKEAERMELKAAITVREPLSEVFAAWENFENFPLFMNHLESVQNTANRRSQWRAKGPVGRSVEWEAEVITLTPNEVIEWRSVGGSQIANSGTVRFKPAPGNQGTEVHLYMEYDPPGGKLGEVLSTVLGEDPTSKVKDDLRRFKQLMETGEIVRSDATPEGPAARRFLRQRPAQPVPGEETVATGGRSS
jgi:uncharacterized membrane protein